MSTSTVVVPPSTITMISSAVAIIPPTRRPSKINKRVEQRGWNIDTSRLSEATNHFEKHLNESFVICSSKAKLLIEKLLCFLIHHGLTGIFILLAVYWQNYIFIASRLMKSVSSLQWWSLETWSRFSRHVFRRIFWSLGLEGLRSRLSLELFVARLCIGYFL